LAQSVLESLMALAKIEISPEDEERGRRIVAELEERRGRRLAGGE
jgi:hypothetical protein